VRARPGCPPLPSRANLLSLGERARVRARPGRAPVPSRARAALLLLLLLSAGCTNRHFSRNLQPAATATAVPSGGAPAPSAPLDAASLSPAFSGPSAAAILAELANPSMQGRHVGTPGELKGANLIAGLFAADGLKPAGDNGSYFQAFPMTVEEQASVPALDLVAPSGQTRSLRLRDDYRPIFGGVAGGGDASGPGLFVPPDADLAGLGVSGKVLFVLGRGSIKDTVTRARDAGALAVIIPTGEQPILKSEGSPPDANALPVAEVSQTGAAALLEGSGHTRDELSAASQSGTAIAPFPLVWTITYHVSLRPPAHIDAHNVLGVLPGKSNARTVIVGAHYEEIGPDPDGVVFPAANDNASGVAVMLELASLLHRTGSQPEATIVFAAWSGHEEGLFGSRYYVDHPVRALDQTRLYLNLDTVGQGSGSTVDAFASDSAARDLTAQAVQQLQADGLNALATAVHSIPKAAGDSDDITFARSGVSNLALSWTGLFDATKIHTPADTADTVDRAKLATTGAVAAALLAEVAK